MPDDRRRDGARPSDATRAGGGAEDFTSFIVSLGAAALHHLGAIPDPEGQDVPVNLDLAKYNIDIMGVLREKTRGNLTPAEEQVFERLLYDVRMRYLAALKSAEVSEDLEQE